MAPMPAEAKPAGSLSVDVAALRLAIEDGIATFGPRYPKGPQYFQQLAELEEKRSAAGGGTPEQKQKIEVALKSLWRRQCSRHAAAEVRFASEQEEP